VYCAHSLCSHTALPLSTHLLCFAHSFVLLIPLLAPLRNSGLSWLPAHAHRLLLSLTHRELKIAVNLHTPPPSYTHTHTPPLLHTHTHPPSLLHTHTPSHLHTHTPFLLHTHTPSLLHTHTPPPSYTHTPFLLHTPFHTPRPQHWPLILTAIASLPPCCCVLMSSRCNAVIVPIS
jgi:hypothetical protein